MKIELVNRNARTLEEAYGLSEKEMEELVENVVSLELKDITNKREHLIPFIYLLDFRTLECAAYIISLLENVEIKNSVDLIETIYYVDEELGKKFIKIINRIVGYKFETIMELAKEVEKRSKKEINGC